MVAFVCLNEGMFKLLNKYDITMSPAIPNIFILGALSAHPFVGKKMDILFGPAALFLRAMMPLLLTPLVTAPFAMEKPSNDCLAKMACTLAGGGLFTMFVTGKILMNCNSTTNVVHSIKSRGHDGVRFITQQLLMSPKFAAFALLGGACISFLWDQPHGYYTGATIASYVLSARFLPYMITPPSVIAGGCITLLSWGISNDLQGEIQTYLCTTGELFKFFISPAISTLGLLTYSHRQLLISQWGSILIACSVGAPLGLGFTALIGSTLLGLSDSQMQSLLPATTTTGLAITMAHALPLAKEEWIPVGTIVCGVFGMSMWAPLLTITGLGASGPFVQGFALGSVSHVSVTAALGSAGRTLASESAAISFFLMGVSRCLILEILQKTSKNPHDN